MRLVIDLQGAQTSSRFRGIGRYTIALTEEIIKQSKNHEIVLVLNDSYPETIMPLKRFFSDLVPAENIRVWKAPGNIVGSDKSATRRRRHAESIYEYFLASLQPDVVLVTTLFEGMEGNFAAKIKTTPFELPTAVICYDFIPLHDPTVYLPEGSFVNYLYMEKLKCLDRADLLLAISEYVAIEAADRMTQAAKPVINISTACTDVFKITEFSENDRSNLRAKLNISKDFIVTSGGGHESRKNLQLLLYAFANLPADLRDSHQLVFTGKQSSEGVAKLLQQAKQAGVEQTSLVFSGYLSDEDLVLLYTDARLMVFPSLDEGFGLPPLEAMSCGTPTLASNAASLPEVIGFVEGMFDPHDHTMLAEKIAKALTDDLYRARLIKNAKEQAAKFSWERSARLAIQALEVLHEKEKSTARPPVEQTLDLCLQTIAIDPPNKEEVDPLAISLAVTFPETQRKRRLFVDVSTIIVSDARTGCQRVTRSILMEWIKNPPPDVEVLPVYAKPMEDVFFHAREYTGRLCGSSPGGHDLPIDFAQGDVFFGLDLHAHISERQARFLSHMQRVGVRILFMVYDLLPLELPEYCLESVQMAFATWIQIITRYDGIIGISQASADAVKDWQTKNRSVTHQGAFEYHAVHLGADIESSAPTMGMPADAQDVLAAMTARPCFLMTGTLEPRKGQSHVLDAFDLLWAQGQDVSLVIVGKKGWRIDEFAERLVKHPEMGTRLFWLDGISDEYLIQVYAKATCLIAASWGEGFGLPLIEAAHHGIPIIARDLPVFREVAGDHAFYFNSQNATGLVASIAEWLELHSVGKAPQSKGMPLLTWAETAKRILDILLERPKSAG